MTGHDIDWYGCVNGQWFYASSMGGFLPDRVNDDRSLPILQMIAYNLPDLVRADEININDALIQARYDRAVRIYREYYDNPGPEDGETFARPIREMLNEFLESFTLDSFKARYTEEFVKMARKGFSTFIRQNIDEQEDNTYTLVAHPDPDTIQRLTDSLNAPLPAWLNYPFLQEYFRNIALQLPETTLQNPDFNLWKVFS